MDSEGILHFSFFFYVLMKGRIATISFGCLWINKFKKGGTHMKEEVNVYIKDCGDIKVHCMNDCPINSPWISEEY